MTKPTFGVVWKQMYSYFSCRETDNFKVIIALIVGGGAVGGGVAGWRLMGGLQFMSLISGVLECKIEEASISGINGHLFPLYKNI